MSILDMEFTDGSGAVKMVDQVDLTAVSQVALDAMGNPQVIPAAAFHERPLMEWLQLTHHLGIYQVATAELIEFLRGILPAPASTIEIGCGYGTIGRALGIKVTDRKLQDEPAIAKMYRETLQPVIQYPADVEKLTAYQAIKKYEPTAVIGAYITQKFDEKRDIKRGDDGRISKFCVDESLILDNVEMYVHMGNRNVHGDKAILKHKHTVIRAPWLCSRAFNQDLNEIYIWSNKPVDFGRVKHLPFTIL